MSKKISPKVRFKGCTDAWEQRKLGDEAIEMVAGGDIDKSLLDEHGKYPVIANALTDDGIVGYYASDYRIKAPAVTVTGRGDVGHAKARTVDFTPVVRLLSVRSKHDVFFLENAINTLNVIVESTGVPQLTVPQLSQYEIFFPPTITEEKEIGTFFDRVDNLITLHQRKLEKMKTVKKSLLEKMFPRDESNIPEIRIKGFINPWEQHKLSELASIVTGKLDANAAKEDGTYAFFTCGKEILKTDTYSFDGDAILISGNGDLGFTRKYSGKFDAYQRTYVLQDFSVNFHFLEHAIHRYLPDRINSESFGGAMPYIKLDTLADLVINVPDIEEIKKITMCLDSIDNLIVHHQRKLELLEIIKKAFLDKMFVKVEV